jgi:hypothetical protein
MSAAIISALESHVPEQLCWSYGAAWNSLTAKCRVRPRNSQTALGAGLQTVLAARRANGFGVALRFFCSSLEMPALDPSRSELLFQDACGRKNIGSLFDSIERVSGKLLNFEQLLPVCEITVTVPVIHDAVGEVFCDSGKLGQLFDGRCIDVDGSNHVTR